MIDCNMSWPPELEPSNGICPLVSVAQVTASKVATANVLDIASSEARHAQEGEVDGSRVLVEIQYNPKLNTFYPTDLSC